MRAGAVIENGRQQGLIGQLSLLYPLGFPVNGGNFTDLASLVHIC